MERKQIETVIDYAQDQMKIVSMGFLLKRKQYFNYLRLVGQLEPSKQRQNMIEDLTMKAKKISKMQRVSSHILAKIKQFRQEIKDITIKKKSSKKKQQRAPRKKRAPIQEQQVEVHTQIKISDLIQQQMIEQINPIHMMPMEDSHSCFHTFGESEKNIAIHKFLQEQLFMDSN